MDINFFKKSLLDALIHKGIEADVASRHVDTLVQNLSEADKIKIQRYNSTADIDDIADGIVGVLNKKKQELSDTSHFKPLQANQKASAHVKQPPQRHTPQSGIAVEQPKSSVGVKDVRRPQAQPQPQPQPANRLKELLGDNAKTKFWVIFAVSVPLLILASAIFFGAFAALYAAVAFVIVAFIALLIGVVSLGSVISLISLIYGIIKLFSVVPEGVYEIGLGFISMGVTMLAGIVIFNAAVRFLPLLFPLITRLFLFCVDKIKVYYYSLKEMVNNL